jgi:hypothetical protein
VAILASEVRPRSRRSSVSLVAVVSVAFAALLLAGCAGPQTSAPTPTQVSTWLTSVNGGTAIGQVEADSRNVAHVLATRQPASAVKAACALLTTDALTAIGNLPSPDLGLTDALNTAYEKAAAAGNDCFTGASGNATLLRRSAAERAALVPLLDTAVGRYRTLTGLTPSTSTTLAPAVSPDPFSN